MTDQDRIYPCDKCGKMRSKTEGGTTFSLCDECWEKYYHSKKGDNPIPESLELTYEEIDKLRLEWYGDTLDNHERKYSTLIEMSGNAQLAKIYQWGNEPCPHSYRIVTDLKINKDVKVYLKIKRECTVCWNELNKSK